MSTNVQVAVRCRPMSGRELARGCGTIIEINGNSVHVEGVEGHESKDFTFDHAYFTESTQDQVYQDIGAPVVLKALDGFNCTIFAYGQTGSGKSFSMMGALPDMPGIIPKLNNNLWESIQKKKDDQVDNADGDGKTDFMITVSFLEIYNEEIKDLLNPSDKHMKIRESKDKGIYVEDLCELIVKDQEHVLQLIDQGNAVRRVAATKMNDVSSRSHSVFTIKVEQRTVSQLEGGITRTSMVKAKLNLVDLAGSERATKTGATGDTLKEGANINMSLMALGNVINALSESGSGNKKKHIPYRDSKLTRLLQESLGGNAATIMVAAISPADYNYDETLSTLKYAHRAKSISNAVVKNEDVNQRMINDLKKEIERLKALASSGGGGAGNDPEAEKKIQDLEEEQKNSFEERERLAQALEKERQANLHVAISSMMDEAKEKKINQMKAIKMLTTEKKSLEKVIKDIKAKQAKCKESVDKDMAHYKEVEQLFDTQKGLGKSEDDPEMKEFAKDLAATLGRIENKREKWKALKDELKTKRERLDTVELEITDERAELVATAGLLDQNDKIRAQIQEEEREKAKEAIEKEIEETKKRLEEEQGQKITDATERIADLEKQLKTKMLAVSELESNIKDKDEEIVSYKKYSEDMEEKLASSQAESEERSQELTEVKAQLEELMLKGGGLLGEGKAAVSEEEVAELESLRTKSQFFEEEKYTLFKGLMDKFEVERQEMDKKYQQCHTLLTKANNDLMYLYQNREELKTSLNAALYWEPPVK